MRRILPLFVSVALWAADPGAFEKRKAGIRALLERCDYAAALAEAAALNREWPDDLAGYQLVAAAHLGLGNYKEAESALQWMLDLRIGRADTNGWLLVARFREATGDFEGAMDAIQMAYGKLAPGQERDRAALLALSGHLLHMTGRIEDAERTLREAGADAAAREALARVRIAQGQRSEAVAIFRELARSMGHPRFLYEAGDYDAFVKAAEARVAAPDNANRELVLYYAGSGKRPAEALKIARFEAERRHDAATLDALAWALHVNAQEEEARKAMKRALETGSRQPDILRHAAAIGVRR